MAATLGLPAGGRSPRALGGAPPAAAAARLGPSPLSGAGGGAFPRRRERCRDAGGGGLGLRGSGGARRPMQAPPALWALLAARLPPSERPPARRLLGPEGLERCAELRAEAETLRGLWRDLRAARSPPRAGAGAARALLGAPGPLKELLRDELRALLLRLRHRAAREGRDPDEATAKYGARVLRFARGEAGGRPGPLGASPGPSLAQRLEPLRDHLSIARLPEVLPQLRALLAEEHRALEELVAHLQRCLEDEHRAATGSLEPEPEPTMAELQEQRRAMERDLQQGRPEPTPSHSHAWGAKPSMTLAPPSPPSCPPSPRSPMPSRGAASPMPGSQAPQSPCTPAPTPPSPAARPGLTKAPTRQPLVPGPGPDRTPASLFPYPPSVLHPHRPPSTHHRRLLPCKGPS